MTGEILFVFCLLGVTIILFVSDLLRLDVVAIFVILALILSGILTPGEALAGFGDPLVVLIGALFVVGDGLFRTGVAYSIGQRLIAFSGTAESRLQIMLMVVVAGLSAFMSSTGAVAILIPVALNLAAKAGISPSRLMMPMAFASLIGGMLTLIGTPPNLAVSTQLAKEGMAPFHFFDFTPIGFLVLITGIVFMATVGRRLLPSGEEVDSTLHDRLSLLDLANTYEITDRLHRLYVRPDSVLGGKTVAAAMLRTRYGVTVLGIERREAIGKTVEPVRTLTKFRSEDVLYAVGDTMDVERMASVEGLDHFPLNAEEAKTAARELGIVEVLLSPRSELIGQTLIQSRFRDRYDLTVLGVLRMGNPILVDMARIPLAFGDSLLVGGGWKTIDGLQKMQKDFLVLNIPREMSEVAPNRARAAYALIITFAMLLLLTFDLVPSVAVVLLAAVAMVLSGCTSMKDAYLAMNWESLVLIAGMLPVASALEKSGGVEYIVNGLVAGLGGFGPYALMAGLFVITSVFSQFISNTATTILVAPIAFTAALKTGISPYPFLMTVAIAASTAFSTPVASPVNTLILGPGGYRFKDFAKVGIPLQILAMAVTLVSVPLLYRLY
ncbi:MAG TPA: SLC13 family permease [Desulfobacterales bacterium]|nr:SLC13 family permease [Desulfobacterales bacterium]